MKRERTDWRRPPERPRGQRLAPAEAAQVWETFLGYLATMSACEASKRPGMPSRVAFLKKRKRDPAYDARAAAVMAARRLETSGRKRITPAAWAEFLRQLPLSSVRKIAQLDGMPSEAAVYKRRQADPLFRRQLDAVLHEVRRERDRRTNAAIRMIALRRDPDFIDRMNASLQAYRARNPAAPRPTPGLPIGEVFNAALLRDELYAAVAAVVPRTLNAEARGDVIADMVLAVLEGELQLADLRGSVKAFTARHWKMFGTFGKVSLDAPIAPGSRQTIGDQLSAEAYYERWDAE